MPIENAVIGQIKKLALQISVFGIRCLSNLEVAGNSTKTWLARRAT